MTQPIAVVSSCSMKGWQEYGRRFLETFARHWPDSVQLFMVSEDELPRAYTRPQYLHLELSEKASDFLRLHASDRRSQGLVRESTDCGWTPKKIAGGYNFRYDAFRFAKKVFAIELVASRFRPDGGLMYWVDADTLTHAPVPVEMLQRFLKDASLCCLDRGTYHSECGFVGYNLDHPSTLPFIEAFAALYAGGEVFRLQEWHDSWVFDWLRKKMNVPTFAIPHASRSHPFANSELGRYMDHLKGARKENGATPLRDLKTNHDIAYYRTGAGA